MRRSQFRLYLAAAFTLTTVNTPLSSLPWTLTRWPGKPINVCWLATDSTCLSVVTNTTFAPIDRHILLHAASILVPHLSSLTQPSKFVVFWTAAGAALAAFLVSFLLALSAAAMEN